MIGPVLMSSSDVVIGLIIAVPVLVVGSGLAVGLKRHGRGPRDRVPAGEVASDAPTDVELGRSAEAARQEQTEPAVVEELAS